MTACFVLGIEGTDAVGLVVERAGHALTVEALQVLVVRDSVTLIAAAVVQLICVNGARATELYWASRTSIQFPW